MGDFLTDFWLWIWRGITGWFYSIASAFDRFLDWAVEIGFGWFSGLWHWFTVQLGDIGDKLHLPDGLWSTFAESMTAAASWIPIRSMVSIWLTYVAVQRSIRFVRWVIRLIPGL